MSEKSEKALEFYNSLSRDPQVTCQNYHGRRVPIMEMEKVNNGYVVDGELPGSLWSFIKVPVVPIMPDENSDSYSAIGARNYLENLQKDFDENVFWLLIQDPSTETGWAVLPVLPSDLNRPVLDLAEEMKNAFMREEDSLYGMKRCAFLAIGGGEE